MKMEGKITEIEARETDDGNTYHRVQVDNKWGSYWGNTKVLETGQEVEAEYEEVKNGQFTNWKKIKPLAQDEEKDKKEQSSPENKGKSNFKDAKKRFEIRKCKALDCAVNMAENMSLGEVKQAYPVLVNLLSKRPDEFGKVKEEED